MAERIRISDLVRNGLLTLTNPVRLLKRRRLDYVVLRLSGPMPERSQAPQHRFPLSLLPWPPPPPSIEALSAALEQLSADRRVKGAVFIISGLSADPANLASLRMAILRFRQSGKTAIAYLHDLSMWPYYLACACDQILAPESASMHSAGLWSETLFLKDTLALAGMEANFEAIAEYKVAPDTLRRNEMTDAHREMLESLLDSVYGHVTAVMAEGRSMPEGEIRQHLDDVPLTSGEARDAGLIDGICFEDELGARLGSPKTPAVIEGWDTAQRALVRLRRWRSRKEIGIISIEGLIVTGPSRKPPLPLPIPLASAQSGSDSLAQQLRAAARNRRLAAVVMHVDSPGGSALASDLIWREIAQLRAAKPIVVYMGNQAASGGYYVSVSANAVIAQPLTLTGSIGIWGGKIVTKGLFDRLSARRETVSLGKAAGLYSDTAAFSDAERERIRADMGTGYSRFVSRVADGRGLTVEEVEGVARGRVWIGKQALAHGLIDGLGDLRSAADQARDLAGLDSRRYIPLVPVPKPKRYLAPMAPFLDAGEWLAGLTGLLQERILALSPWQIRFRA